MCPRLNGEVCTLIDIGTAYLDCVGEGDCQGNRWHDCSVYISQFFFDKNDDFVA